MKFTFVTNKNRVMVYVRFTRDVLISEKGYSSFERLSKTFSKKIEIEDKERIKILIEESM